MPARSQQESFLPTVEFAPQAYSGYYAQEPVDPTDLADRKKYDHGISAIRNEKRHSDDDRASVDGDGASLSEIETRSPSPKRGARRKKRLATKHIRDMTFDERVVSQGLGNLYGYSGRRNAHSAWIELVALQRMVLYDLQRQLVAVTADIARSYEAGESTLRTARNLLNEYVAAVRNFDFMTEHHKLALENDERDSFLITTEDPSSYYLMNDHLMLPKRFDHRLFDKRIPPGSRDGPFLPGPSRTKHHKTSSREKRWRRLWMGLCGGVALIAPMLLMVLHNDTPTTLATASAATILFALGLAWFGEDLDGKDVLASVAAYAAVMVVFIGTSS